MPAWPYSFLDMVLLILYLYIPHVAYAKRNEYSSTCPRITNRSRTTIEDDDDDDDDDAFCAAAALDLSGIY